MASILVVSGPHQGEYYPLGRRSIVVGRDEACGIQIVDDHTSRRHVEIRCDKTRTRHRAVDLDSANGTFVNDRRLSGDVLLTDGDILRVGASELMYSALDFTDREMAFEHYRQPGEHGKSTVLGRTTA